MSVLNDYPFIEVADFRGPNLLVEPTDVLPPYSLEALNCEFEPGSFRTRIGFYEQVLGLTPGGDVCGAFNYIYGTKSKIIWAYPDTFLKHKIANYDDPSSNTVVPLAAIAAPAGAVYAQFGRWIYIASYDSSFAPSIGLNIIDMEQAGYTYTPLGFRTPLLLTEFSTSYTDSAATAGLGVTPGEHRFAIIFEDRTGFQSRPSPVINAAGLPLGYLSYNTALTDRKITITVTPATVWPSDITRAYLIATTATNLARFLYVPVEPATVASGAATPFTFDIETPDSILAEQSDIGDQQDLIVYESGTAPFTPNYVFAAGARMGYLSADGLLVSDPEMPQRLVPDLNIRTLPQQRQGVCAKYLQGTIYVFGPDWTYAITDSGDTPNLWAPWRVIDEKIGTSHPYGISVDDTGFGFVAHKSGLYAFSGGQYTRLPLSYFQSPLWDRIDWTKLNFNVVIDPSKYQVQVFCELVGDGTPTVLMWDYTDGLTPSQIKFSRQSVAGKSVRWGLMVLNRGDSRWSGQQRQLWMAPVITSNAWLLRRHSTDANLYLDSTNLNIATDLSFAYLPKNRTGLVHEHHGLQVRATGAGSLRTRAYKLDRVTYQDLLDTPLTAAPEKIFTRYLDLRNEAISYRFRNSTTAGDWIRVSYLKHFHTPYIMQR